MRFSVAILPRLRSVALLSTRPVHWIDAMFPRHHRPSGRQIPAELPRLASSDMARKLGRPSRRHRPISRRAGGQACLYHHLRRGLRQAARGHRVLDLATTRTAHQVILQLLRRADQARLLWGLFHQRLWDGRMNQLQPELLRQFQQGRQQLTVCTSIPVHRLGAITITSHRPKR